MIKKNVSKYLFLIIFFFAFTARAELITQAIKLKKLSNYNYVVYFTVYNNGEDISYISSLKIKNFPKKYKIHKTIISNGVARIIEIDQMVIPSKMEINSESVRIFVPIYNFKEQIKKEDIILE